VRPGAPELERNSRARSARLRVAERTPLEQAA
jgi:16S rRNA C1402 N4-methylase RsmH